jgi:hypothetical protein
MIKKITTVLAFGSLLSFTPVQANTTDGLIIGGFAGLTAGLIGSAVARNCQRECVIVEEPVYVAPPVVYERPVVVERPVIVEERVVVQHRPKPRPYRVVKKTVVESTQTQPYHTTDVSLKERELALRERQTELELIKAKKELLAQENKKRELDLKAKQLAADNSKTKTVTRTVSVTK